MAKLTMKEIRELANNREDNKGRNKANYNSDIYPFWLMEPGDVATIRFLPDKNKDNPFPFIEKLEHKLPINGNTRKIACPKMYGNECAICDKSKEYYDAEGKDSENGKFYYRDRMHLARALILEDPVALDDNSEEDTRVGKVKIIQLGFQLYEKIMEQLGSFFDDDDPRPWDLEEGFNFKIKPVKQGNYKKYDLSSSFEKRPSEIPEEYLENIEIVDLRTLLPEEVDYDKSNEFLHAHLSGGVAEDNDSLESKKRSSGSSRKSALDRMKNEEDDDGDDADMELDDDDRQELEETINRAKKDDTEEASTIEEDDDDDDDDEELKAIIARRKAKKKKS